ncbi:Gpr1 family protein [Mycena maculata]|uniref:Gpr1 family protein n=1 Tax=Mycena maculata TaxID=230809 RepID=A0AAD7IDG9_9AGAR|nr:Gpr1 family protein [Mycena maculata]
MASPTSKKGRVSTIDHLRPDVEQGAVISTSEGAAYRSGIANPAPMGLFAFATTTFVLSLYTVQARSITVPNVVVGMAIFSGGLTQVVASMWEFPRGNAFGATVFASYGSFWMSYGTIYIPASGIIAAYSDPTELANTLGIYIIAWCMVTLFFLLLVIRANAAYTLLLSSFCVALACLSAGQFTQSFMVTKAGGVFLIIGAFIAYYIAMSELLASERRAVVRLPLGVWQ